MNKELQNKIELLLYDPFQKKIQTLQTLLLRQPLNVSTN